MISATANRAKQFLATNQPLILPSLLQCDFGNLAQEIARLEDAGVRALHLDVMDGHFVPNLSYGMPVVAAIRKLTDMPLDVHLMISEPSRYVSQFVDAGADCLTIHAEIEEDHCEVLECIRGQGIGVGIAINPGTPLEAVESALPLSDLLLIMSVDAGFGGQTFNPVALDKLKAVKASSHDLRLEVDGGVNLDTIAACHAAGASLFVAGSAIFGQDDYRSAVDGLVNAIGR